VGWGSSATRAPGSRICFHGPSRRNDRVSRLTRPSTIWQRPSGERSESNGSLRPRACAVWMTAIVDHPRARELRPSRPPKNSRGLPSILWLQGSSARAVRTRRDQAGTALGAALGGAVVKLALEGLPLRGLGTLTIHRELAAEAARSSRHRSETTTQSSLVAQF
jgi:hypothetical protein